jgi:hypothetical protein
MKNRNLCRQICGWVAALVLACVFTANSRAGQPKPWNEVPEAVRVTILAHGGKEGAVDLESGKRNGKAVYEAPGKDQSGNEVDLVVTEDGKLLDMKHDAAEDKAKEESARAKQARKAAPRFSHPRNITNPWLPLASLKQDILEGKEGGKTLRVERTLKPEVHKTFPIGQQTVESLAMEDREFENGQLAEVTLDYFAQADDGTVYYLGEDVDEYKGGKVVGHSGAWLLGQQTQTPGVILPGKPKVGDQFRAEDVAPITTEDNEIISLKEKVTVPAGSYKNCLKVKEMLSDGGIEYKYYAKGVGCIRELPEGGDLQLISHTKRD